MTLKDHILGMKTNLARKFRQSWTSLCRWKNIYFRSSFTRFPNSLYNV